eukprot:11143108-Lingulodinium_polyedra.AAC.1
MRTKSAKVRTGTLDAHTSERWMRTLRPESPFWGCPCSGDPGSRGRRDNKQSVLRGRPADLG